MGGEHDSGVWCGQVTRPDRESVEKAIGHLDVSLINEDAEAYEKLRDAYHFKCAVIRGMREEVARYRDGLKDIHDHSAPYQYETGAIARGFLQVVVKKVEALLEERP